MTFAASLITAGYEPLGANAPIKSFTGEACQLGFTTPLCGFVPGQTMTPAGARLHAGEA